MLSAVVNTLLPLAALVYVFSLPFSTAMGAFFWIVNAYEGQVR